MGEQKEEQKGELSEFTIGLSDKLIDTKNQAVKNKCNELYNKLATEGFNNQSERNMLKQLINDKNT